MTSPHILTSEQQTKAVAAALAPALGPGDTLLLTGPVGAGKSLFARTVVQTRQAAAGAAVEDVPSPSFTLVQTYQAGDLAIWHADLYRLSDPSELEELGLFDAFEEALVLVEWPGLLGEAAPPRHLGVHLEPLPATPEARALTLTPAGPGWAAVLRAAQSALEPAP
ncbi:tRNA (adenosine(37)-N6)-threonylcarbamoyltransferase complex ATPase subunit type 1 TsaE [Oceanibium sediminis]|uniref:tRNA (adenosine(37)-N6)-threonylcarbamoyltransferase complex ATPase subunit type 1 TsaE n=1 Tax=Oceanibium sediminis TaxID=2026339 RepID=UPI000DD3F3B6|nr:tRNA (adenosine(37)-N6)-threonylcarbamoyltransferase complex ATPase subunit type 1 TsaE [Oceanibium sediminis]